MSSRRLCTCLGLPTLSSWHYCYVHFTHKTSAQLLTCLGSYRPHGRVGFELRRSDPRVHDFDHSAILNPYNLGNPSEFNNILSSLTTSWQCLWSQLQLFSFCLTSKTMILALMSFLCCRAILFFHTSVPKVPADTWVSMPKTELIFLFVLCFWRHPFLSHLYGSLVLKTTFCS